MKIFECNNDIIELKYPIYEELEVRKFCKKFPFRVSSFRNI